MDFVHGAVKTRCKSGRRAGELKKLKKLKWLKSVKSVKEPCRRNEKGDRWEGVVPWVREEVGDRVGAGVGGPVVPGEAPVLTSGAPVLSRSRDARFVSAGGRRSPATLLPSLRS